MAKALATVATRGKSATRAEHPDDDETKAAEEEKEKEAAAKAAEEEEEKEAAAKAAEDEEEKKAAEEEKEEKAAAKAASGAAATATAQNSARAITDLCALAGRPELAGEFIASGKSQASVRKALLSLRAAGSNVGEIAGQTSPSGSPAAAAAMWDHATKKNSRFFGHA